MRILFSLMTLAFAISLFGAGEPVKLPPKEKFLLVLLAGQSNMAGRGKVTEADKLPHPRVLMLDREGNWVPATDPVHYDKRSAGVGPGRTFADLLAATDPGITVGLIPAACGGSPLKAWRPGVFFKGTQSHPYDDAIARTKKAMESGTLTVILFHQGESDCKTQKQQEQYYDNLMRLFAAFRTELNAKEVPIIVGQLGSWEPWGEKRKVVDAAQRRVVQDSPPAAFVTSEGLTCNPDNLHFDRASQIEFGKRYFGAYCKLTQKK